MSDMLIGIIIGSILGVVASQTYHLLSKVSVKPSPDDASTRLGLSDYTPTSRPANRPEIAKPESQPASTRYAESPPPAKIERTVNKEEELYQRLLVMAMNNRQLVDRLIENETRKKPAAGKAEILQDVIDDWVRDRK